MSFSFGRVRCRRCATAAAMIHISSSTSHRHQLGQPGSHSLRLAQRACSR